jgi:SM-20-related protein
MMPQVHGFNAAADALQRTGWCVLADFVPAALSAQLARECGEQDRANLLQAAATGRGTKKMRSALRGDRTRWFDPAQLSAPQQSLWSLLDALRLSLNRDLLLGLESLEAHYAVYPVGSGYARHLDRFSDDDARVVSCVLYLNADWRIEHGGALRLHLPEAEIDILPHGGTLVLFLSAEVEHEVLTATRQRMSIAGWFRRRPIAG